MKSSGQLAVLLRHELRRIVTGHRRSARIIASVAIPVAAAAWFILFLGGSQYGGTAPQEVLGASFEQFSVLAGLSFVLLEVGLVATASGLVGLDRRRREIGLWMVNGATRGAWIAAQAMASALLGACGALLGLIAAIALAQVAARVPGLERVTVNADTPVLVAMLPMFGGVAVIAVCASSLAGWLPAKFIGNVPLRDVLLREGQLDRTQRTRSSSFWLVVAFGSLCAVVFVAMCGARDPIVLALAVLFVVSAITGIPALLGCAARFAPHLPIAWRIAVRDASRMSPRFTPAIVATAISVAVAIAVATLLRAVDSHLLRIGSLEPADRGALDLLLLSCGCAAIATTQIATHLCAIESDSDARVLLSIGAEPATVRAVAAASAGYIALISVMIAIPSGVVAATGVLALADAELEMTLPWPELLVAAVVVPSIAYLLRAWRFTAPSVRFAAGGHA